MKKIEILKLLKVMQKIRDPKNGCLWDKKQTMETIIPHSIEEVYEVAEQVYNKNYIKLKMTLEKIRKVLKIAKEPVSLETPVGDEEDSHLGDFIQD